MLQITMTKEMIIEEIKQVACEERAHEFAIKRLDFDGLIKELDEINKIYMRFVKEKNKKYADDPRELALALHWCDSRFSVSAMETKHEYYAKAFNFDSEVMIDFDQWYEGTIDEIEEEYEKVYDRIEEQFK